MAQSFVCVLKGGLMRQRNKVRLLYSLLVLYLQGTNKIEGTLLKWRVPFARIGVPVVCQLIELIANVWGEADGASSAGAPCGRQRQGSLRADG